MNRALPIVVIALGGSPLQAQPAQPVNPLNLFVAELRFDGGTLRVGTPVKLTGDRGVNSQPSFTPDGRAIVFSAQREGPDRPSDVYRIELANRTESRLTRTPENENTPTISPRGELLAIRWTPATLFKEWGLWAYSAAGEPRAGVLPAPDTVGYYVQVDDSLYALMRPANRFSVALFDARKGQTTDIEWPVAPLPPQRVPGALGGAVSFTRTDSSGRGRNEIRRLDLGGRRVAAVAPTIPGRTSHVWVNAQTLLMGKGNTLYVLRVGRDSAWKAVAVFAAAELQNVTTYAVSPRGDQLILTSTVKVPLHVALRDSLTAGTSATAAARYVRSLREAGRLEHFEVREPGLSALGAEALTAGRAADAVQLFELQTELFPASFRAHMRLGDAHKSSGDPARAAEHYRRSLALNARASDDERRAAEEVERALRELEAEGR